jgi:hypothetical protein
MRSSSWESGVANSTRLCSTRAGVGVDVPGGVAVAVGVHAVTDCGGGGGEDLVAAEVVTGERGAEVGGGSRTGVDMLSERELPTPPAPSKLTYLTESSRHPPLCPMPILALRRTLYRASCAHPVSLGQECDRHSSPPRSR